MTQRLCPYCHKALKKNPKRKSKCPHCSQYIFVRSRQNLFTGSLLTEEQARAVDWFYITAGYGITKEIYFKKKMELSKKFAKESSYSDIIWGLFNDAIILNSDDYHILSMIYYQMAIFLEEEGKDPFPLLQDHIKMQLLGYQKKGAKKVKIMSIDDRITCDDCKKLDGKIMTVEEALKRMPIIIATQFLSCLNSILDIWS